MADYQIPKCDCGGKLLHWQEEIHAILTPITKSGLLSKRSKNEVTDNGAWERLRCEECFKEYNYDKDEQERIVRSSKWND